MSDYKDEIAPNNSSKEERESNTNDADWGADKSKGGLETEGPQKKQYNVLNEDGSLADLPDQDVEGAGAGDGTIGG
ncbi:hypothetical protein [Mucilaginibacter celer]|uniref:Uncharacterized protein n=1 Tax=Mucilaginibacter celer TaxID=2305508 RepID=A0A494VMB1_9SPHI|nr:hypothetical protein [Mucilaginibacter celer]AYL95764.1 hypothetical protein HYN43_010890 [Mucilaginibacter celer]